MLVSILEHSLLLNLESAGAFEAGCGWLVLASSLDLRDGPKSTPKALSNHSPSASPRRCRPPRFPGRLLVHCTDKLYSDYAEHENKPATSSASVVSLPSLSEHAMSTIDRTIQILRMKQLQQRTGLSRSAIYDRLDKKSPRYDFTFPKPLKLSPAGTAIGFLEHEVEAWIISRIKVRNRF